MNLSKLSIATVGSLLFSSMVAFAGEVKIENVVLKPTGENSYRFSVTVSHNDTGWDHYADEWQVIDAEGNILGTRILAHPHVNEQPFTRSSGSIAIPTHLEKVYIRAKDNVHGWAKEQFEVKLK
ncbi:hypothetical protein [Curvivirga sp.]|uniref:hypothetical protein n=1 Tax=Curvivirga sp. TaxID=2856848 RepID=UPI003B590B49